ncbi:MAG: T9SS type A sorting domain-containing protein [Crocinitomicaceae bacterium]|nr:T9SS type A sorting domain-containing protein [Crocinitomicaceae bacterium]
MRSQTILFLILFCCSFLVMGQTPNSWTKKADFGALKRERAVAFSIGEYGYVATGEDTNNVTYNDLWRYDPLTDTWSQMANLPASTRRNAIGFALENKGYVGTGIDSSESFLGTILVDFWEYDPLTNGWTQKANYPGAGGFGVYYAGSFVADNKGYVTCGKYGPSAYAFDLWEYKPSTDSWSQRANFPGGVRYAVTALSINNKGYVGMGIDQDLYRKDWWEYDPSTNVWEQKSNLPGDERGAASSFTLGSRGFVIFGADGGFKDELWQYNPYTDSWNIKSNIPGGGRRNGIAFSIGNKGYAGIGKGSSGIKKSFYEYTPAMPLAIEEQSLTISFYPNPAIERVNIYLQNESDAHSIILINNSGQIVEKYTVSSQTMSIERNNLTAGNYFVLILDSNQSVIAKSQFIFG